MGRRLAGVGVGLLLTGGVLLAAPHHQHTVVVSTVTPETTTEVPTTEVPTTAAPTTTTTVTTAVQRRPPATASSGHYSTTPHVRCVDSQGRAYTTDGTQCPAIVTTTTVRGGRVPGWYPAEPTATCTDLTGHTYHTGNHCLGATH